MKWVTSLTLGCLLTWSGFAFAQVPQIISTSPTQNELSIPIKANISVTFDIDMDTVDIQVILHEQSRILKQVLLDFLTFCRQIAAEDNYIPIQRCLFAPSHCRKA
jgi:hypothetical protein